MSTKTPASWREMDYKRFLATYVDTNAHPDSKPYNESITKELLADLAILNDNASSNLNVFVLMSMCCALKRGDLAARILELQSSTTGHESEVALNLFEGSRETINVIWPFVGVPQIIPACFGLAGLLSSIGVPRPKTARSRPDFSADDSQLGVDIRRRVYKASANSEVFEILETYFGDFAFVLNAVCFGYNLGRAEGLYFSLPEAEIILTSALVALGATRQAGSHIKACIGFDVSEAKIEAVIRSAEKLAAWDGSTLPSCKTPIALQSLAEMARKRLEEVGPTQT